MATIGIDFGTSYCSASWINPNTGRPEAVRFKDCGGNEKLPSIIAFNTKGQAFVGAGPEMQFRNLSADTSLSQEERKSWLKYFFTSIKTKIRKDQPWLGPNNEIYTSDYLISLIIKKIKDEISVSCPINESIDQVVLTHPVQFEEWKKDLLKHAAALAGFKEVKLIEEPIAAAIYAIKSGIVPKTCKGLLVYDFGAGTFDVSYIQVEGDGELHKPVLPRGDARCGGDDIDRALYEDWEKFIKTSKNKSIGNDEEIDMAFLYRCRCAKEEISRGGRITDEIRAYIPDIGTIRRDFSDSDFERLTKPFIDKTCALVKVVADEVKQKNLPLTHAILIGGSSNLPQVQTAMKELLGNSVNIVTTGDNDIAVAVGAMYSITTQIHVPQPPKPELPKSSITQYSDKIDSCFCIYCGRKILTVDKICMYCGKPNWSFGKVL